MHRVQGISSEKLPEGPYIRFLFSFPHAAALLCGHGRFPEKSGPGGALQGMQAMRPHQR
jgi:hypothetical protein